MELLLEFEEEMRDIDQERSLSLSSSSSTYGYKLVPWLNWDEWEIIRDSLFSSSADKIAFALTRISVWRSRGCLPVVIDVTASIIEIQQKDLFFCKDPHNGALHSEQMLAMLYCMAILRLVNCVVEKTRKKTEVSIAEAADAIGIPRVLIDVRHEGSHRDLPALQLVRDSSIKALNWLKSYYWDPQKKQIPFQRDGTTNIRKEIKSKLRELAFCLKVKQSPQAGSSSIKGKYGKHSEQLCGRNKFFSLMAGKLHSFKSGGSKKQITKTLKILVQLYSSFSSEVVSVLLEFLLKALDTSNLVELPKDSHDVENIDTLLDDWKLVITKLSNKEPEFLLTLLKVVLDMIENQKAIKYEMGTQHFTSEYGTEAQIERLSSLFAWLVGRLKGLKPLRCKDSAAEIKVSPAGINISNAILMKLLRKCLLVSTFGNNQLMESAVHIAQLMGDSSLIEKLNKLSLLGMSNPDVTEENSSLMSIKNLLIQQEESIRQAAKNLELVKLRRMKNIVVKTTDGDVGNSDRWVVAKSWNPCPIGMLPRDLGSSGCLPVLDHDYSQNKFTKSSESKENWELTQSSGRREANCDTHTLDNSSVERTNAKRDAANCDVHWLDNSSVKKMRKMVEGRDSDGEDVSFSEGVEGRLMIGGICKKVGMEELLAIESGVRILV